MDVKQIGKNHRWELIKERVKCVELGLCKTKDIECFLSLGLNVVES